MRVFALAVLLSPLAAQGAYPDEAVLNRHLGRQAVRIPAEQVLDYTWSNRGATFDYEGRRLEAFEGLSNRVCVRKDGDGALAFGSLVVVEEQTTGAVLALARNGADVASLTPRFPGAAPQPYELRFYVRGTEARIGAAVAAVLGVIGAPAAAPPRPVDAGAARTEWRSEITAPPLEAVFGRKSEEKRGVVLFRLPGPRALRSGPGGFRMGVGSSVAFAGRDGDAEVHVDATVDRAGLEDLLRSLDARGFRLASLLPASPGLDDDLVHASLRARGEAAELARVVRAALDIGETGATLRPVAVSPGGREVLLSRGGLAAGWTTDATHPAGAARARWIVEATPDDTDVARVADPGDADNRTFNLLWNPELRMRDGRLAVRMRAIDGRLDQGGGLIWRARDADNYYVTRFNPLEQDFRVYRVRDGVREQLQAIGELPFRADAWFTIEVEQQGDHIRCTLEGVVVLDVRDETFPDDGGIGLWSKADSRCAVAGLWFEPADADADRDGAAIAR